MELTAAVQLVEPIMASGTAKRKTKPSTCCSSRTPTGRHLPGRRQLLTRPASLKAKAVDPRQKCRRISVRPASKQQRCAARRSRVSRRAGQEPAAARHSPALGDAAVNAKRCPEGLSELTSIPNDPAYAETINRIKGVCEYQRQMDARGGKVARTRSTSRALAHGLDRQRRVSRPLDDIDGAKRRSPAGGMADRATQGRQVDAGCGFGGLPCVTVVCGRCDSDGWQTLNRRNRGEPTGDATWLGAGCHGKRPLLSRQSPLTATAEATAIATMATPSRARGPRPERADCCSRRSSDDLAHARPRLGRLLQQALDKGVDGFGEAASEVTQ